MNGVLKVIVQSDKSSRVCGKCLTIGSQGITNGKRKILPFVCSCY